MGDIKRSRVFVRDIEPDPGWEVRVFDPGDEVAIEPGTWEEFVPASERDELRVMLERLLDVALVDGYGEQVAEEAGALLDRFGGGSDGG